MPKPSETNPLRLSLQEQAALLDRIVARCVMVDGRLAAETFIRIDQEEADHLTALANRLHLISPYEGQIRRLVTGR